MKNKSDKKIDNEEKTGTKKFWEHFLQAKTGNRISAVKILCSLEDLRG